MCMGDVSGGSVPKRIEERRDLYSKAKNQRRSPAGGSAVTFWSGSQWLDYMRCPYLPALLIPSVNQKEPERK